ncbi:MAG: alkaline phosphatase [Armatimonadota bacterium]
MKMVRTGRLRPALIAFVLMLLTTAAYAEKAPKNIILMIGDGMGVAQVTLARLSMLESGSKLNMESMPHSALVKNQPADAMITDSAAAASALATGFKTNNGMISTLPDGTQVATILEAAEKIGKSTGLVTTTTITHATPAGFGSHVGSRGDEAEIAPQFLANKIEVLMGGGRGYFIPKSDKGSLRADERDLISEAAAAGYGIALTRDAMLKTKSGKLVGLFQMGALTTNAPEPSLAEMTDKAIDLLSADEDGFFLMVEGGQIDWSCHSNDAPGAIKQTADFDKAIGEALDFAREKGNTLVVVTADHETGGLCIVYPEKDSGLKYATKFTTTGHTACNIPLFAEGPGSKIFDGVMDNTDLPKKIAKLWKIKNFAVPKKAVKAN